MMKILLFPFYWFSQVVNELQKELCCDKFCRLGRFHHFYRAAGELNTDKAILKQIILGLTPLIKHEDITCIKIVVYYLLFISFRSSLIAKELVLFATVFMS